MLTTKIILDIALG